MPNEPDRRDLERCKKCKKDLSSRVARRHDQKGCPKGKRRASRTIRNAQQELANARLRRGRNRGSYGRIQRSPTPPPDPRLNQRKRKRPLEFDDSDDPDEHRRRHRDFRFDSPGAGPSDRSPSPIPLPRREGVNEMLAELYEEEPWLQGLTSEQIAEMQAQEEIERRGGFKLREEDLLLAEALNYKVTTKISENSFKLLPRAFPRNFPKFPKKSDFNNRVAFLTGMKGIRIDCCVNSCVAYTGPYKERLKCPICGTRRYRVDKRRCNRLIPRRTFTYIPLISRIANMYRDKSTATLMGYRARRRPHPDGASDIFDGEHYKRLQNRRVKVDGRPLDHRYFSSPTDVALGLSTDGFGPFKHRKQTCWPILIFNYNLPPAIRHRLDNLLCVGVIPGPCAPKELDTFLEPLIEELEELARGVPAFDGEHMRPFCLRAHLIACFGDMPAVAKLMCMKGHNGKHPCRACNIIGIRGVDTKTHYTPLARPFAAHDEGPRSYDPHNLPRRTHLEFLRDALHVENAKTTGAEDRHSRQTGIKGLSTLTRLGSLDFPGSFPHDFMHLVFENVLPTLILLWTRKKRYAKFGNKSEPYHLQPTVWSAIGQACQKSGDTIPSRFGCRVPNVDRDRKYMTSESRLLFATLLAPGLLRRRFQDEAYYRHFMLLVQLISKCCSLENTRDDIQFIREGFIRWVKRYEECVPDVSAGPVANTHSTTFPYSSSLVTSLYYRKTRSRLMACTLPVHALLHVADDIETMGPVWCYWAFPMEHYCGSLGRTSVSRRFPYASLDRRVLEIAQLAQFKTLYGLRDHLNLDERHQTIVQGTKYDGHPNLVFAAPHRMEPLGLSLQRKVAAYVGAYLRVDPAVVGQAMANRPFEQWGCMQQIDQNGGGDLIRSVDFSTRDEETSRDASFVKYETMLGRYQWDLVTPQVLREPDYGYGRANRFVIVDTNFLHALANLAGRMPPVRPLLLTVISPIPHLRRIRECGSTLIQFKYSGGNLAKSEVIDAADIECLVGRCTAPAPQEVSYIVDRETVVGRLDMLEELADLD